VYNIDETEAWTQVAEKQIKDKASLTDQPKHVLLCDDIVDQRVYFDNQLYLEQESALKRFLFHNKDVFA
jgi:hypoxanthine phosphoribosyltransferase